jgi:hypothetical protein
MFRPIPAQLLERSVDASAPSIHLGDHVLESEPIHHYVALPDLFELVPVHRTVDIRLAYAFKITQHPPQRRRCSRIALLAAPDSVGLTPSL